MELRDIYELWDRFDRSDVDELELNMHGTSFHLRKGGQAMSNPYSQNGYPGTENGWDGSAGSLVKEQRTNMAGNIEKICEQQEEMPQANLKEIKAPLVGTYYIAPSPDAEPFVKVGQEIHKGDVIGIIEAMKLMNEVTADADGHVVEILAEDGKMVEYNQVLLTMA